MNVVHFSANEPPKGLDKKNTYNVFYWILRLSILAIIGLGFLYLILLNSISTKGFVLEELKIKRLEIQKQMEEVDIALAIPSSLYALKCSEITQEMEDVKKKDFLVLGDGEERVALGR